MKCRIFSGPWNQTQDSFNNWAKGKALTKEIIIHTAATMMPKPGACCIYVTITVYYPEGAPWEGKKEEPARWDTPIVKE